MHALITCVLRRALKVAALAVFSGPVFAQTYGIIDLGAANGFAHSYAIAVSGDGKVILVGTRGPFLLWTQATGMAELALIPGSSANGMSLDGGVVVGGGWLSILGHGGAFRWTPTGGLANLGNLPGASSSVANGVSSDGSVIVGTSFFPTQTVPSPYPGTFEAFRWTQASGIVGLGQSTQANAVSGDGSVIAGSEIFSIPLTPTSSNTILRAMRWTQSTGWVRLGNLNGGARSEAFGISRDGNVIVGYSEDGVSGSVRAFRWTQASGMTSLGSLPNRPNSSAAAVNADGSVVVGSAGTGASPSSLFGVLPNSRAYRWTQATGMQSVEDWLRSRGVKVATDSTIAASGVSDDGNVVVGTLLNGDFSAFVARASQQGSGMITVQDLQFSLISTTNAPVQVASLGSTVLHGAHSRPLAHRVAAGKSCVWTAGDVGRDDHGHRGGEFGLAEIGVCHRLAGDIQGSLSVGVSGSRQDLEFNGNSNVRTRYGVAELLGRIPGTNFWPSAAFLFQQGHAEARRGYVNAGALDYSRGRPGVQTTALRLRVDWDGAARAGAMAVTPYADVSQARTRIDAYTEGGGGFPAQFNGRTEKATEARVGADAAYALHSDIKLLGRLEGVHRFEKTGANTSGTVLGLSSFDFPGRDIKRDWLRAGVGIDVKAGPGVASAMLNATTQGVAPSYWLNVSYLVAF